MSKTLNDKRTIIQIVYILYLLSFFTGSLTAFIGLIMALCLRDGSNAVELAQFKYQVSVFWKYLIVAIIGVITLPIFIGAVILLGLVVWTIYKIVKGFEYLNKNEIIPV